MHRLIADSIAFGVKTVLVGAFILDIFRQRELPHLPSVFAMVDMAKEAWLREAVVVLQSADPLAYRGHNVTKNDLN
jgi:hypothetical protein